MVEFVHELNFIPHIDGVGLVFVHLEDHHVPADQVLHLVHFTEEACTKSL